MDCIDSLQFFTIEVGLSTTFDVILPLVSCNFGPARECEGSTDNPAINLSDPLPSQAADMAPCLPFGKPHLCPSARAGPCPLRCAGVV
eukprot:6366401-Amphidinium_carterae.1